MAFFRDVLDDQHAERFRMARIRKFHKILEGAVFCLCEDLPIELEA